MLYTMLATPWLSFSRLLLLACFNLFFSSLIFAQFDKLRNYNVKDGLPSSDIYSIMQDSKGYIWLTGDMGVTRFDGYRFYNLSTQTGLADNTVFGSYEDYKHRIWFRSFSGKLSYYYNDSIYSLPCNDSLAKCFGGVVNNAIYVDKNDTIWLSSIHKNVIKISPGWKTKDIRVISVPGTGRFIYNIDDKGFLFSGHNDSISVITIHNKFNAETWSVRVPGISNANSRFFISKTNDGAFLGSLDKICFVFNRAGLQQVSKEDAVFISVKKMSQDVIAGATTNGVRLYTGRIPVAGEKIKMLNGKVITDVMTDNENQLWFTTEGHGVYSVPHSNFRYYTPDDGLTESKISCLGLLDSMMAVGHLDGTITVLKKDSLYSITVKPPGTSPIASRIFEIFNYRGHSLVGTPVNGYMLIGGKVQSLSPRERLPIRQFQLARDGNLWGLLYSSLDKFDAESVKSIHSIKYKMRVDNFYEDSRGTIWMGAMDGIHRYDSIDHFEGARDKRYTNRAVAICEADDHSIWIATRGGGVLIAKKDTTLQITEKEGLAGNMCRCILISGNAVWVGTNKGLSRVTVKNNSCSIKNFYTENGLLTNEVNYIANYEGKLWLAHSNGVSIFDPLYNENKNYSPPVYIQQVKVNNATRTDEQLRHLQHDENYIAITYVGLCYKMAGGVEYRYKMEGVDSTWLYTKYTTVNYPTLPVGNYTFIIQAKSSDGTWSRSPAKISLTILPAWWQTMWFRILGIVIFLVLIAMAFRYRLQKIRRRDREKIMLRQRVAESELQALRSQMNPHFIFNAINSVQYFITRNDPESSQRYLAKFAKLIRYVVDNSKPTLIPLRTELDALNLYLELESLRFEDKFNYEVIVDPQLNIHATLIPSMLIQPYIENAIWHGLMHKEGNGTITVSIFQSENALSCVIKDNGIGRKRSAEIKLKSPATHKSLGLALTKERLDIINQLNNTSLSVVINDLYDKNNNAVGTSVMINIPLNTRYNDNSNNS